MKAKNKNTTTFEEFKEKNYGASGTKILLEQFHKLFKETDTISSDAFAFILSKLGKSYDRGSTDWRCL